MSLEAPILPYAGTSGWSGSEASKERAVSADKSGQTHARQKYTSIAIAQSGENGLTWKELSEITGWHHGIASGVLSVLHKQGEVVRLREQRNRSSIYVHPVFQFGRPIAKRKTKSCKHCGGQL
jgi:DNA-binding MarR family transcriptional regulator